MKRSLLLGHRGARAYRQIPENTLASFELCLEHGCDGFEFDVRRSADGQAVICHDPVVRGMEIAQKPAAALALPSLLEVLRSFCSRAFLDIELKAAGLEQETAALLRTHPPQKGYVVSSFLPEVLKAIHELDATVPVGLLCENRDQLGLWRELPVEWVVPQFKLADRELIEQIHEAGKRVMVWTANGAESMRQFAEWGVDALISDETELVTRVLRVS
ncbi:MAG: glycerophosphodiester phosphodiesterase [Terriglobales bacterium]